MDSFKKTKRVLHWSYKSELWIKLFIHDIMNIRLKPRLRNLSFRHNFTLKDEVICERLG